MERDLNPRTLSRLRFSRPLQSAILPSIRKQFRDVTKMVEPVGLEPTFPPCKGGVLPLNYGPSSRRGKENRRDFSAVFGGLTTQTQRRPVALMQNISGLHLLSTGIGSV